MDQSLMHPSMGLGYMLNFFFLICLRLCLVSGKDRCESVFLHKFWFKNSSEKQLTANDYDEQRLSGYTLERAITVGLIQNQQYLQLYCGSNSLKPFTANTLSQCIVNTIKTSCCSASAQIHSRCVPGILT